MRHGVVLTLQLVRLVLLLIFLLQILALIAEVKQRTGLHVSQSDAFINPTVKQLAGHMFTRKCRQTQEVHGSSGEEDASRYSPVLTPPPVEHAPSDSPERTGWQPAGSGQEQMAVVDAQGFGAAYNMPWCLRLRGPLNVPALKEALLQTVRLEEVLRTLVRLNTSTMRAEQLVLHGAEGDACLEFVEQTATSLQEATAIVENEQNYLFDIQKAPIVRVNLVKINPEDNLLLVNMHHANSDGWSVALHRRQVLQTYVSLATAAANGAPPLQPLPPHSVTFLDFSWWQRKWLEEQGGAEQQLAYWKKELDGAPVLDLPYDRPRPERFTEHGGKVDLHIPAEVVARWRRVLAAKGCTIFMGALALYHVLLSRW